jgi:hypothetical protein
VLGRAALERAKIFNEAEKLLAAGAGRLFGVGSSIGRRRHIPHLPRPGFEVRSDAGERVAGIDLYLPDLSSNGIRDPLDTLAKSVLLSFYFPRFYVALAPGFHEDDIRRTMAVLDAFDAGSIGILHMPDGSTIRRYRHSTRPPNPDRSAQHDRLVDKLQASARGPESDEPSEEPPEASFRM